MVTYVVASRILPQAQCFTSPVRLNAGVCAALLDTQPDGSIEWGSVKTESNTNNPWLE
jgi:hypothetical protein